MKVKTLILWVISAIPLILAIFVLIRAAKGPRNIYVDSGEREPKTSEYGSLSNAVDTPKSFEGNGSFEIRNSGDGFKSSISTLPSGWEERYLSIVNEDLKKHPYPVVPPGVKPVLSREDGLVIVTYPFNAVLEDGTLLLGPDYYIRFKIDAVTGEIVAFQVGG